MSHPTKSALCIACVFGFATSTMLLGQQTAPRTQDERSAAQIEAQQRHAPSDQLDSATSDNVMRASQITGRTVYDPSGNSIGTINDLVLDTQTGRIRYAALSFGGFLGFGNKLFAIPWQAIECRHDVQANDVRLVIDVNEATLREAPGFDQDSWPDFGDKRITERFDNYYRTRR